ncbi:MAG: oligopeptide transport system ATP-binding protein [Glaciecola sp.]|jgi:oligopeptide transport system ATP-binding protein
MSVNATSPTTMVGGRPADPTAPLLKVTDLRVEFETRAGTVVANDSVSYTLNAGETLAILGESGSGKSVSAQAVMGIIDTPPGRIASGSIEYRGVDLLTLPESQVRKLRGNNISIIFQDALTALNPVFTVGHQIAEMFRVHRGTSKADARKASIELLDRVRIPDAAARFSSYPHEFSGGMRQRAMIAMALALDPDVLIADEPTTALDVTVQAQIMELLADLQKQTGMGLILITHDLGVVAEVAERVAVMYAGRIVEEGLLSDVFGRPAHPYTRGLMHSIPRADAKGQRLEPIQGSPPDLLRIPSGCSFHPRCEFVIDKCSTQTPLSLSVDGFGEARRSACHRIAEVLAHG